MILLNYYVFDFFCILLVYFQDVLAVAVSTMLGDFRQQLQTCPLRSDDRRVTDNKTY